MSTSSLSPLSKKLLRGAGLTIVALALLYLGAAFALSRFLDPEALAAWIEPRMERAFNRDVEVSRAEIGFLPVGLELKEVSLADPTGLAPHLATVESIDLRVELLPLIRREVRISRLTIQGPRGNLVLGEDGRSNYGDFSAQTPEGEFTAQAPTDDISTPGQEADTSSQTPEEANQEGRGAFALNLRSIRVVDGELTFTRRGEEAVSAALGNVRMRAAARQDSQGAWILVGSWEGDLTAHREEATPLLDEAPIGLRFDVASAPDFSGLEVRTSDLRLGTMALEVSGTIDALKEPVRAVNLDLSGEAIPLADLLAFLPEARRSRIPGEFEGIMAVNLRAEGEAGPGQMPSVTGRIELGAGRLTQAGTRLAEDLTAELLLLPDRSIQVQAQAEIADGPFSVDGTVSLQEGLRLDVEATPDLASIVALLPLSDGATLPDSGPLPDGVTLSGQLPTQLRITGPLGDFRGLRFRGNVQARSVQGTHPSLGVPFLIPEGEVSLDGVRILLQDFPVHLGDDSLRVSGEVPDLFAFLDPEETPQFRGSVRGPRIDLRRLSSNQAPDSALTYGKVAFAKIGGRSVGGRAFQDAAREMGLTRPASLPLAGGLSVALDTVVDRQGRMEEVTARLDFGPSFVRVTEAGFKRYGGEVLTTANLSFSADEAAPFSFRLQVRSLDAGRFLSQTTSLGRFVRGTLSMELDVVGTLDGLLLPDRPGLVGSGSFALTGGGLATAPITQGLADFLGLENLREPAIRDWGTSFVLDDGRVRLADATMDGAPGSPRVGGSVGLDGGLDLQSVFNLPSERLNTTALNRLGIAGEIAANLAQRPEVIQAVLRIGGSVFDPSIQADPAATASTLGAAIREEVGREAQERIDAQRAEAERILQEQQAEAQRRIAEQREQLQNRATGLLRGLIRRPDTVRPDTTQPDTVRPDTTRPETVRPDTTRPDTVRPDTTRPDTVRPDTIRPDTTRLDTVAPSDPTGTSR
jgi:hypothetical protein